jgi:hypothetical protein
MKAVPNDLLSHFHLYAYIFYDPDDILLSAVHAALWLLADVRGYPSLNIAV